MVSTKMPPVEVHQNGEKSPIQSARRKRSTTDEKELSSRAEQFSGILTIKDPRIIEEIAERDLLA